MPRVNSPSWSVCVTASAYLGRTDHVAEIPGAEPGKRHCFIIQPEERQREQGPGSKRDGIGPSAIFDFLYKWGMLLTVVLLVAVFGLASDNFLDPFNIINILRSELPS